LKVQFIWPNFGCPLGISLGISYLAGVLKSNGIDVNIIHISEQLDYTFDTNQILCDIEKYSPDIIAISFGENHYQEMKLLLKETKQKNLKIPVVFGGIHTTLNTQKIFDDNPLLDFAIIGEGEDALLELVQKLEKNISTLNIKNLWIRNGNEIVKNKMRALKNLNYISHMHLDSWNINKIINLRNGWFNISMNRGCPHRCSFCHNEGFSKILMQNFNVSSNSNKDIGYLRLRNPDDMISELVEIKNKYKGINAFSFIDDTFTFSKTQMLEFLPKYKEKVGLPFVCLSTVIDVDYEILNLLKDSGCTLIRFGVETATERIKEHIIKRNFSNRKIEEIFDYCRKIGLKTFAYNILAHPNETIDEILNTLKLNAKILPNGIRVSLGYPYPGTEYYNIAKEMNLIDDSISSNNYLEVSKFKWDNNTRFLISKISKYYWIYMNSFLNNESSKYYVELIKILNDVNLEEYNTEQFHCDFLKKENEISSKMIDCNITHYYTKFIDRPDITILYCSNSEVNKNELDSH